MGIVRWRHRANTEMILSAFTMARDASLENSDSWCDGASHGRILSART